MRRRLGLALEQAAAVEGKGFGGSIGRDVNGLEHALAQRM